MNNIFLSLFQNNYDQPVAVFLVAHRNALGISIFNVISFFGNWQFLLPMMVIILVVLFIKKQDQFVIPFVLEVIGAEAVTFLVKIWLNRPRPLLAVFHETDPSFPSGHATIAVAFYGYLTYILVKSLPNKYRRLLVLLSILIIIFIGFSRLYLGVHYVSDVLAGYLVGLTALIIGIKLSKKSTK